METIGELLNSILDEILAFLCTVIERFVGEPGYRAGFLACFAIVIVGGVLSSVLTRAWDLVHKFFSATKGPPSPSAGPTPVGISGGCAQGAVILFVFAVVTLLLLYRFLSR